MADVTYVKRDHLGSGNYEWTYKCRCESGQSSMIKVVSGNQIEAAALAQLECDMDCGEAKAATLRHEFVQATAGLRTGIRSESAFNVWVNEVTDSAFVVTLCSGDEIIVPREMVKRFRPLGRTTVESSGESHTIVRLEFDEDAPGVTTVIQLAKALEKQLGSAAAAFIPDRESEVCQQVKVRVSGMACDTNLGYYISPYPMTGYSLARAENCQVTNLTRIGQTQLRFAFTGPVGTPCANNFGGVVYIDVCWVQPLAGEAG